MSLADRCEELEQQLASYQAALADTEALEISTGERLVRVEQQLAATLAACKLKDEALEETRRELDACQKVIWLASDYGFDPAYVNGAKAAIASAEKALSIRF